MNDCCVPKHMNVGIETGSSGEDDVPPSPGGNLKGNQKISKKR